MSTHFKIQPQFSRTPDPEYETAQHSRAGICCFDSFSSVLGSKKQTPGLSVNGRETAFRKEVERNSSCFQCQLSQRLSSGLETQEKDCPFKTSRSSKDKMPPPFKFG